MMTRRDALKLGLFGTLMLGVSTAAIAQAAAPTYSLDFDPENFETLTTTITVDGTDRAVTYRFYKAIPYVANPVDVAYQSLNISVPVEIDGVAIDASAAPILFSNSVGGYMPSSTAEAAGIDDKQMPAGMMPPAGATEAPTFSNAMMARGEMVSNAKIALASGLVVVEPGARGRTLTDADGIYYGVAPAAIVDLKAAVRYLRHNAGTIPGNVEMMFSSGTSAGGALSTLLGASGDSPLYDAYLDGIGAAKTSDAIFAVGAWCPITDLEHADMAYEWCWGPNPLGTGDMADAQVSADLAGTFPAYQAGLGLNGIDGSGTLTADTYGDYLVRNFMIPSATAYLTGLSEEDRAAYLAANTNIGFENGTAVFDWDKFRTHVGARKKAAPSFDAFDLSSGENNLFGTGTTAARHFTQYSLQKATGDANARLDDDLAAIIPLMNPMKFLLEGNSGRAKNWWLRLGAKDTDTSHTVVGNLSALTTMLGDTVDTYYYWDAGHGANEDATGFIGWISSLSGYKTV